MTSNQATQQQQITTPAPAPSAAPEQSVTVAAHDVIAVSKQVPAEKLTRQFSRRKGDHMLSKGWIARFSGATLTLSNEDGETASITGVGDFGGEFVAVLDKAAMEYLGTFGKRETVTLRRDGWVLHIGAGRWTARFTLLPYQTGHYYMFTYHFESSDKRKATYALFDEQGRLIEKPTASSVKN